METQSNDEMKSVPLSGFGMFPLALTPVNGICYFSPVISCGSLYICGQRLAGQEAVLGNLRIILAS
jgi:hypothetical protein